jgi:multidrug efflux system membrane fusion protein
MDEQPTEILVAPGNVRIADDIVRPAALQEVFPKSSWRSPVQLILWMLFVTAIAGAGLLYFLWPDTPSENNARPPSGAPIPVGLARVEKGDMPVTLTQLGTVTPLATVTVKTQISGYLMQVAFQEGQIVNKGDFLAQIDPRPYQVALGQAQAQLAKDQALLKNAQLDLQRYNTLVAQRSIAKQTRDTQASLVSQYEATVRADQAQSDVQKLNLVYCRIVSPVTGRVGLRQIDPGNYVQTNDTNGIVVVTQLQPISVVFTLPEDNLPEVMKRVRTGAVLAATAYDRTGSFELAQGKLETVDTQIDTKTATVKLRAIFDNEEGTLFPNQFVNVQLLVATLDETNIVPSSAIQRGAPGSFVYLVKPNHTVSIQRVKLGPGDGQLIAILSGLQPGETVVVNGTDRLREGAKISLGSTPNMNATAANEEEEEGRPLAPRSASAPAVGEQEFVAPASHAAPQPQDPQPGDGQPSVLSRRSTP